MKIFTLIGCLAGTLLPLYTLAQNVGIGTTNPTNTLEIHDAGSFGKAHFRLFETGSDFTRIRLGSAGSGHNWDIAGKANDDQDLSLLSVYYSGLGRNLLTIRGDGNVGINSNNPTNPLEIRTASSPTKAHIKLFETNAAGSAVIRLGNSATPNTWDFSAKPSTANTSAYMHLLYSGNGSNIFSVRGDGNVGINNSNPVNALDITANSDFSRAQLRLYENEDDFTRLRMQNTVSTNWWDLSAKPSADNTSASLHLYYSGNGSNIFSVRGDGNVGINDQDPENALDITANSDFSRAQLRLYENEADFSRLRMQNTLSTNWWDFAARPHTDNDQAYAGFFYSALGNNVLTLRGNGNVGIGNGNPTNILDVQGNTDFSKVHLHIHETDADYTRIRMTNTTGGNFWDLATRPDVSNNSAAMNIYYSGFGANILSLQGNGNAVLSGVLTQNSDVRLKKNIQPIEGALEKILSLNGYTYNWSDHNKDSSLQAGVLAQEVQRVFPELVKEDAQGTLSVNYSGLIPVLIEAIKQQQQKISELEEKLNRLTSN